MAAKSPKRAGRVPAGLAAYSPAPGMPPEGYELSYKKFVGIFDCRKIKITHLTL